MTCEPGDIAARSTKGLRGLLSPRGRCASNILDNLTIARWFVRAPTRQYRVDSALPSLSHQIVGPDSGLDSQ
jgi:hypothetical protein